MNENLKKLEQTAETMQQINQQLKQIRTNPDKQLIQELHQQVQTKIDTIKQHIKIIKPIDEEAIKEINTKYHSINPNYQDQLTLLIASMHTIEHIKNSDETLKQYHEEFKKLINLEDIKHKLDKIQTIRYGTYDIQNELKRITYDNTYEITNYIKTAQTIAKIFGSTEEEEEDDDTPPDL